jgi:hypothetical protein
MDPNFHWSILRLYVLAEEWMLLAFGYAESLGYRTQGARLRHHGYWRESILRRGQ